MKEMQEFEQVKRGHYYFDDLDPGDDPPYIEAVAARDYDSLLAYTKELAAARASEGGWIEIKEGCKMPDEFQDILYVVTRRCGNPFVVQGQRNYEENAGWWWCNKDGNYDDVGNDPGFSTVTHWQPLPSPPLSV